MITKGEWDRAFELTMPMLSVGVGTLSVALATIALVRSSPGQRVYYRDGQHMVSVRYPGQWYDLRDFIQPDNPDVIAISSEFGPDFWSLYDFVCRNIDYRMDIGEVWQFPSETLRGTGDCEDTSFLLTSLIRAGGVPNCYVALGSLGGYGHAWCQLDGQILETTFTEARYISRPEAYESMVIFNESEVIELWPGALGDVFELGKNEELKLKLMAEALCTSP